MGQFSDDSTERALLGLRVFTLGCLLWLAGPILADDISPPSIYTHYFVFPQSDIRSGELADPAKAVASIHIVRPIELFSNPPNLLSERWQENRATAFNLRRTFRQVAEAQYRLYGRLKGEIAPEIALDLDTLVRRKSAIVAISDPGDFTKLYQMASVAYDQPDGLPLETRLVGPQFAGIPRFPHRFEKSNLRFMEIFGSLREIPIYSKIMSFRPAVENEPVEIKTFIRGYKNTQDWVPMILRTMTALELLRNGVTPLTAEELTLEPALVALPETIPLRDPRGLSQDKIYFYLSEKTKQRTVRIDRIFIEVMGQSLAKLYTEEYGFSYTPWFFPDPHIQGETIFILRAFRSEFEDHVVDGLVHRKGHHYIQDYSHFPVESGVEPTGPAANCLLGFSQLGRRVPAVLNTRGSILDESSFLF